MYVCEFFYRIYANEVQNNSRKPGHGGLIRRIHASSIVVVLNHVYAGEWFSLLIRTLPYPVVSLGCKIMLY